MSRIGVKPKTSQEIPVAGNSGRSRPHPDPGWEVGLTWLYHFLRLGLACIFIYAGFIKLLDPRAFAHAIAQYDLIPETLLPLVAVGLPALELLAGLGLVFEVRGSLTLMAVLLLIFLVILGYAVWHNLDIDCGCFTAEDLAGQEGLKMAFRRDLIMIGATLFLYWRRRSRAPQRFMIGKINRILQRRSDQMTKKHGFLMGGLMAVVAFALMGCGQSWSGKELATETAAVNLSREVSRGGYNLVSTPELKGWIDQKKPMMIIDTMPMEDSYKKQHVLGAVQYDFPIPEVKEMDDAAKAKFEEFLGPDKDKTLVFYCGFVKCTRSHNGAMWAVKQGYKNVYRCPGGIKAWDESGYPVAKGDK